jgi:photosystem II stability/assembly factor-like uncharacterized protein
MNDEPVPPKSSDKPKAKLPAIFKNKKLLLLLIPLVLFLSFAAFKILTDGNDDTDKRAPGDYVFLTMEACNNDMKTKYGMSPNNVNNECMRLEKELKDAQTSLTNFVPMPLECNSPPIDQWYRTDNTFMVDHKNPNTMYVNVEWKGLYKTTDDGKTWTLKVKGIAVDHKDKNTGKPCYGEYPVAIMDPTNNQRILLATSGGGGGTINDINMRGSGVYETTDGAESWHQTINGKMNGQVNSLTFDPKNPQSFYYGSSSGPASYTEADPNKIWITTGLIYKTPDNGKSWEELPTGFAKGTRLTRIMIDPRDTNKITALTISVTRNAHGPNAVNAEQMGIIKTLDGGKTWKRIDNLPKGHEAGFQIEVNPTNPDQMHYVSSVPEGKNKGFTSSDGGKTWTESSMVMDVFRYDKSGRLVGYQWQAVGAGSKVLYQSSNNGKTWTAFGALPSEIKDFSDKKTRILNIVFHPTDKNTFYMTGANGYVWKTTDGGTTWTTLLSVDKLPK